LGYSNDFLVIFRLENTLFWGENSRFRLLEIAAVHLARFTDMNTFCVFINKFNV